MKKNKIFRSYGESRGRFCICFSVMPPERPSPPAGGGPTGRPPGWGRDDWWSRPGSKVFIAKKISEDSLDKLRQLVADNVITVCSETQGNVFQSGMGHVKALGQPGRLLWVVGTIGSYLAARQSLINCNANVLRNHVSSVDHLNSNITGFQDVLEGVGPITSSMRRANLSRMYKHLYNEITRVQRGVMSYDTPAAWDQIIEIFFLLPNRRGIGSSPIPALIALAPEATTLLNLQVRRSLFTTVNISRLHFRSLTNTSFLWFMTIVGGVLISLGNSSGSSNFAGGGRVTGSADPAAMLGSRALAVLVIHQEYVDIIKRFMLEISWGVSQVLLWAYKGLLKNFYPIWMVYNYSKQPLMLVISLMIRAAAFFFFSLISSTLIYYFLPNRGEDSGLIKFTDDIIMWGFTCVILAGSWVVAVAWTILTLPLRPFIPRPGFKGKIRVLTNLMETLKPYSLLHRRKGSR